MSNDLLRRLDECSVSRHQSRKVNETCLEAAARIRELEAIVADWKVRDEQYAAVVAERDAAKRLENVWCSAYRECDKDRDALRRDNEALRALLRRARPFIAEDTDWCYDAPQQWLEDRIDAALAGEGK